MLHRILKASNDLRHEFTIDVDASTITAKYYTDETTVDDIITKELTPTEDRKYTVYLSSTELTNLHEGQLKYEIAIGVDSTHYPDEEENTTITKGANIWLH